MYETRDLRVTEQQLVDWQYGRGGGFYTKLYAAIAHSDGRNRERLRKGFPYEVEAVERYQNEAGYWQSVLDRYKERFGSIPGGQ